jgi:hypothetical protein
MAGAQLRSTITPGHKARHILKWARTMTKWVTTFNRHKGWLGLSD